MIIRDIIDKVERLRTLEWQCEPHRQPNRLPDTILLRIELLRLPHKEHDNFSSSNRRHIDLFVEKAIQIIDGIANSRASHEPQFLALRERVNDHCGEDRMYISNLIGAVDAPLAWGVFTMTDMLRVRLAVALLNKADWVEQWESEDGVASRKMIQRWEGSANEELREEAFAFRRALPGRFSSKPNVLSEWFA
jgi:hypothetical protein